jgi:hypothetical protein
MKNSTNILEVMSMLASQEAVLERMMAMQTAF